MHANVNFLDTVNKTALVSINLSQKQSQDVQLELLNNHIKFHLDQIKSVAESEANRFCFPLALWPPGKVKVDESGKK